MNQYDAVCMRKSVRRFKMELLPQAFFKNLRKFEQGLQPLEPELSYSIEIVDAMGSGAKFKGRDCTKLQLILPTMLKIQIWMY